MSGNHNMFCSANQPSKRMPSGISECAEHLRKYNEWRRGDPEDNREVEMPHPRELGLNIDFAVAVLDAMAAHDHLIIVAAFRYCLGRRTYVVGEYARLLVKIWSLLSGNTKNLIHLELEEEFKRDDKARADGLDYKPLGLDCDRAEWSRVRKLWENK